MAGRAFLYLERTLAAAAIAARQPLLCERAAGRHGLLQAISPLPRTLSLLACAVACALLPARGAALLLALVLAAALASGIGLRLLVRAGWGAALVLGAALAAPALVLVPAPGLAVTAAGAQAASTLLVRVAGAAGAGLVLALTTPWHQVCRSFGRCGVPPVMVAVLEVSQAQAVALAARLERMALGRRSRQLRAGGGRAWVAGRIGALYRTAQQAGEWSYLGMLSRGYRVGRRPGLGAWRWGDYLWLAAVAAAIAAAWWCGG